MIFDIGGTNGDGCALMQLCCFQELVMKTIFLISVLFCLALSDTAEAAGEGSFTSLAPAQTTTILNSLDAQQTTAQNALDVEDRIRARELERARADVRRRLGDRSAEPTIRAEDFASPSANTTNHQKP